MKNKTDLFELFNKLNIAHKTFEHEPLFTVEQADKIAQSIPGTHIKNLFLKDDDGQLWLLVAESHAKIELKKVAQLIKGPKLRFADEKLLWNHLGVKPGLVTPFGLINDSENKVKLIIDDAVLHGTIINAHPLENTATTSIKVDDFKKFLDTLNREMIIIDLANYSLQ